MSISVVGAGAFGTALAIALAHTQAVTLWARDATHVAEMDTDRENARRLPKVSFPKQLDVSASVKTAIDADIGFVDVSRTCCLKTAD